MTTPDTDATPDRSHLESADRPATSDPAEMRDDLAEDPTAASPRGDDAGGAG